MIGAQLVLVITINMYYFYIFLKSDKMVTYKKVLQFIVLLYLRYCKLDVAALHMNLMVLVLDKAIYNPRV